MKQCLYSFLIGLYFSVAATANTVPSAFDKEQIETNVLKKFISLQSERDTFYRINDIVVTEVTDSYYHKPGYSVQINYSTPECKNNYFKGLAYIVACTDDECPFGMVYRQCYE